MCLLTNFTGEKINVFKIYYSKISLSILFAYIGKVITWGFAQRNKA